MLWTNYYFGLPVYSQYCEYLPNILPNKITKGYIVVEDTDIGSFAIDRWLPKLVIYW